MHFCSVLAWEHLRFRPSRLIAGVIQHVVHYFTVRTVPVQRASAPRPASAQGETQHEFDIFSSPQIASRLPLWNAALWRVSQCCLYCNLTWPFLERSGRAETSNKHKKSYFYTLRAFLNFEFVKNHHSFNHHRFEQNISRNSLYTAGAFEYNSRNSFCKKVGAS